MHRAIIAIILAPGLTPADVCQWTDATGQHFAASAPPGVQALCKPSVEKTKPPPVPANDAITARGEILRWRQQAELWHRSPNPRMRALAEQLDEQIDNYERATDQVERARAARIDVEREFDDLIVPGGKTRAPR